MTLPTEEIKGLSNTTAFPHQMVLIGKLFIDPKYRSLGIGNKLLEFVLDIGIELDEMVGCMGIIVDATNNKGTINFYEKFGFEEISRTKRTVKMFFKIIKPD
jgi:ribosomal protein S18 acetylase RimI-like enzyme